MDNDDNEDGEGSKKKKKKKTSSSKEEEEARVLKKCSFDLARALVGLDLGALDAAFKIASSAANEKEAASQKRRINCSRRFALRRKACGCERAKTWRRA